MDILRLLLFRVVSDEAAQGGGYNYLDHSLVVNVDIVEEIFGEAGGLSICRDLSPTKGPLYFLLLPEPYFFSLISVSLTYVW